MADKEMTVLDDLFKQELRNLHSVEQLLIESLPKLAGKAHDPDLKDALNNHVQETIKQRDRLKQICAELSLNVDGVQSHGIAGIIAEGEELLNTPLEYDVMDAAIVMIAQRIEHYEISCYGTICDHAGRLGNDNAAELLKTTLAEEKKADALLSQLAKSYINDKAKVITEPPTHAGRG